MGEFAKRFEDLEIWQEARRLAVEIYLQFKDCRDFGFRNQIQDASVSVMNNIAEGFERRSRAEFRRFLDIAKGSSGETRSMLYLAQDVGHIDKDTGMRLISEYEVLSKRISSLMATLRRKEGGKVKS
ncbi:four helix bundle protein [Desulfonatronovibrio hydrogenovorans]|uniref:four helix bundle protein n=1 Tax=Desulfonatronovibrio hydrogenovorans TaxID=53245 RepID=UPI00048ACED5|nr:four helix bundle protein [Desulfonatronovibrio hydrogenovorans]